MYPTLCLNSQCNEFATVCRVASRHFSQVEANESDGLLTTIAGIQDLNILFSNVAFVAVLRAFVQVMEAGVFSLGIALSPHLPLLECTIAC
jgi:hypothetical protein